MNKKDYGIKSQSRKLNHSQNKSNSPDNAGMQAAYGNDESSPERDLNALASFQNIDEVNEDDSHLIQILYSKVDENVGNGNRSPRNTIKGLITMTQN